MEIVNLYMESEVRHLTFCFCRGKAKSNTGQTKYRVERLIPEQENIGEICRYLIFFAFILLKKMLY